MRGLEQLRGEFTILIFDRLRKMLIAVRDRVGVKPLYYTEHEGAWYFASEVEGLARGRSFKSSPPNVVLTSLGDRMEMAGSLEGRLLKITGLCLMQKRFALN
ncbi:asparagine synthetase B (glutamine-hydrolyzing) [Pseudomonas sp. ADAK2 TE3594]